jgi:hypothetical protein
MVGVDVASGVEVLTVGAFGGVGVLVAVGTLVGDGVRVPVGVFVGVEVFVAVELPPGEVGNVVAGVAVGGSAAEVGVAVGGSEVAVGVGAAAMSRDAESRIASPEPSMTTTSRTHAAFGGATAPVTENWLKLPDVGSTAPETVLVGAKPASRKRSCTWMVLEPNPLPQTEAFSASPGATSWAA